MVHQIALPEKLTQIVVQLRQLVELDIRPQWQMSLGDRPFHGLDTSPSEAVSLNDKGYVVWSAGREVCWLTQRLDVPVALQDYPLSGLALRLALMWWAEDVQIFVDRQNVQAGDLFDSSTRLLLSPAVQPGDSFEITLRLVSPGHDIGALMRSVCLYESHEPEAIAPGQVADELSVLALYLAAFAPEKLEAVTSAIARLDWDALTDAAQFNRSLANLRQTLLPFSAFLKQRSMNLLGHAHLDMAWLWPVSETWDVAQRTFESVLNLQQEFPELTFGHTSAVLYAWIEQHRPELFQAIQQAVQAGRWELLGGMWVEPEVNLVAGESLVRQLLYGQGYFQAKFGAIAKVAWLPDSFGFCWQLPQILKQAGIEAFVTGKLHWNDTTKFPHDLFWWRAPDGSELLTLMSPPNLTGVMDTHPLSMANYGVRWEQNTQLPAAFWLPGVGDHGGGPTRDMLHVGQKWAQSPFFPTLRFTTAQQYLQPFLTPPESEQSDKPEVLAPSFPVWQDELYLEFHRGCYTTHGDQKHFNRRCETLLYQAELWASLAQLTQSTQEPYPQASLEIAWKKVLFNQFHDILPGTSIPDVFSDANRDWQAAVDISSQILQQALTAIAQHIDHASAPSPDALPLVIFNSLNWQRSDVIRLQLPPGQWTLNDHKGQAIATQLTQDNQRLFLASDIPSIGYRLFWLCPAATAITPTTVPQQQDSRSDTLTTKNVEHQNLNDYVLENEQLRVIVDGKTGDICSLYDQVNQQEMLSGPGNHLQTFQDQGQYWDAWNIDPDYENHALPSPQLKTIAWLETGPIRWRLRVIRTFNQSEICQDYLLSVNSNLLTIATEINWQENQVLLKATFPLSLQATTATYETAYGAITRSTQPETPAEKAKWEVPALNWADLTDQSGHYGCSILTDSKYGYDAKPDHLRLTLLRSPHWPDPQADRGTHRFHYAIYPHSGTWQTAKTTHRGYEFNVPLHSYLGTPSSIPSRKALPAINQLLHLSAPNLMLSALKLAEESEEYPRWVLRCYEAYGESAMLDLSGSLDWAIAARLNLLEQVIDFSDVMKPWAIASFDIVLASELK